MNTYISMLRGINLGNKTIRMADLKSLYESLGFVDVRTYVQSGNVVFESSEPDSEKLETLIEEQIEKSYVFQVATFVRDKDYFKKVIDNNPFVNERHEDPVRLHVTFLYKSPGQPDLAQLATPKGETDEFAMGEKEIYLFCPNGYGRTKLSNTFFEKKLKVPATTRNWNTVNALFNLALANK
jgi:uncharacterized protein (DUF1697 family)